MTDFVVVIPARRGAERLPGKPLRELAGRPLIAHVLDRALESGAGRVVVATDDEAIAAAARAARGEAMVTAPDHPTGTDRIAEVVQRLGLAPETIVVNLQGDEPLIAPSLLADVAADLAAHGDAAVATLSAMLGASEVANTNVVKVVCDAGGYALYFSRAAIPWAREGFTDGSGASPWQRHVGIYAYRAAFLRAFPELAQPPMEALERLEQLRALWHGYRIHVTPARVIPEAGVDTAEDLERVEAFLLAGGAGSE